MIEINGWRDACEYLEERSYSDPVLWTKIALVITALRNARGE